MPFHPRPPRDAVITGGASGIGRSIALALALRHTTTVLVLGRDPDKLDAVVRDLGRTGATAFGLRCDLAQPQDFAELVARMPPEVQSVDTLVHSAGFISAAPLEAVAPAILEQHFRVNAQAPLLLTQALLPQLKQTHGQVVFVNSSVGVRVKERVGAYAASKHALKAIADTLRMEIGSSGVRVLSVYPGNTATPMQRHVCRELGAEFQPDAMLAPDDVAAAVLDALMLPATAEVTDLHIRPSRKPNS